MITDLQKFLFQDRLSRMELLKYKTQEKQNYRIQVFRNHSFELVEHTLGAFLDYAGIGAQFIYGGYDDSLSFVELDSSVDLILLWIDTKRYMKASIVDFLDERISQLRIQYSKPILLIVTGEIVNLNKVGVVVLDLTPIQNKLVDSFFDDRMERITGTRLSSKAMVEISKEIGLRYLPVLLHPPLKAIIVDLDNTIYSGVLGEDGIDGLVLTNGHIKLQEELHRLSEQGFFLCIISKNEQEDVEKLFEERKDFPLKRSDFSKIIGSWEPKSKSLNKMLGFLNISSDSVLFIDDNMGELIEIITEFPKIKIILAEKDARLTYQALKYFPGLLKLNVLVDDIKRKEDIKAKEKRDMLQKKLTQKEYMQSLQIQISFTYNDETQINRIFELANKTNQFIFNYKRYTCKEVEERIKSEAYIVLTISLKDRLSDSGIIGVCVGCKDDSYIQIEECFVSCRALGRGLDAIIVLGAIQAILDYYNMERMKLLFKRGERNLPAFYFVKEHLQHYLEKPNSFHYKIPNDLVKIKILNKKGE